MLRDFYATVRNGKGELYGLSSYIGLRAGLNRHINDPPLSLSWSVLKDTEFTTCNNVFTGVVKMLRKKGLDTSVHHSSITEDDFKAIKQVLDPKTPEGLVNKVWFDVHLHFRRRGNEGWTQDSTGQGVAEDPDEERVTLNLTPCDPSEPTNNWQEAGTTESQVPETSTVQVLKAPPREAVHHHR
ncbi:putative exonuclease domain containing protein, partial [Dissostichus eleginoides]